MLFKQADLFFFTGKRGLKMEISKKQEARVFGIKEAENRKNTIWANISTYEGKTQDDKSKYSSWNTNFVGGAYEKAKMLQEKDVIILTKAKIENTYDKEKEKLYVNLTVFDFDMKEIEVKDDE